MNGFRDGEGMNLDHISKATLLAEYDRLGDAERVGYIRKLNQESARLLAQALLERMENKLNGGMENVID